MADWYHDWLDRALAGDATPPFPASEIDAMKERSLEVYAHLAGPAAVERFDRRTTSYFERVVDHWDLPYAFPFGGVTAGLHVGVAAAEWHLHAWDLSTVDDFGYRPSDPKALFVAVGRCVAAADGRIKGAVLARIVPIAGRWEPWQHMLRRSGRGG